jgi:hypothetical protein
MSSADNSIIAAGIQQAAIMGVIGEKGEVDMQVKKCVWLIKRH